MTKELDRMIRIATLVGGANLPDAKPWNPKNARGIVLAPLCFILGKKGANGQGVATLQPTDPSPAAPLQGLKWLLPKLGIAGDGISWTTFATVSDSYVMGGTPGHTYQVELRLRGVVELSTYTGTVFGTFCKRDGSHTGGGWNSYGLTVSSPSHEYWVNSNSAVAEAIAVDYTITVPIEAGATVTLHAASNDNVEDSHNISVSGVTDPPQPYLGQWMRLDVLSVTE